MLRPLPFALALAAGAAVLVVVGGACRDPTEVVVQLSTDVPCAKIAANGTRIVVGSSGELDTREDATSTYACDGTTIGTVVLVPSGGRGDAVAIEVISGVSRPATSCTATSLDGCILARRRLRYLAHTPLRLPIAMRQACVGVVCAPDETCVEGLCRSAEVDPTSCVGAGCDEQALPPGIFDGGAKPDATTDGATNDAATDAIDEGESGDVDAGAPVIASTITAYGATCGIAGGETACWGKNESGEVGGGPVGVAQLTPLQPALAAPAVSIVAGESFTCALEQTGAVECWGAGVDGQLGNGARGSSVAPVPVPLSARAVQLSATLDHTCALLVDGSVPCWGNNGYGELGAGSPGFVLSPRPLPALAGVVRVSAGVTHTCAIVAGGAVHCLGDNAIGQLGDGTTTSRATPAPVRGLPAPAMELGTGGTHACALLVGGEVWCWGSNDQGELGNGATSSVPSAPGPVPTRVVGLPSAVHLTAAVELTCAIVADGAVWCWGSNIDGELGNGVLGSGHAVPAPVPGVTGAIACTAGHNVGCARTASAFFCWGYNADGQLGRGFAGGTLPNAAAVVGFP